MIAFLAFIRFVHEASLMALFGSACLLALLAVKVPELALEGGALALGRRLGALAALVSAPVWLALSAAEMSSLKAASKSVALWQMVSATLFGQMFLARFILLLGTGRCGVAGTDAVHGACCPALALVLIAAYQPCRRRQSRRLRGSSARRATGCIFSPAVTGSADCACSRRS